MFQEFEFTLKVVVGSGVVVPCLDDVGGTGVTDAGQLLESSLFSSLDAGLSMEPDSVVADSVVASEGGSRNPGEEYNDILPWTVYREALQSSVRISA